MSHGTSAADSSCAIVEDYDGWITVEENYNNNRNKESRALPEPESIGDNDNSFAEAELALNIHLDASGVASKDILYETDEEKEPTGNTINEEHDNQFQGESDCDTCWGYIFLGSSIVIGVFTFVKKLLTSLVNTG